MQKSINSIKLEVLFERKEEANIKNKIELLKQSLRRLIARKIQQVDNFSIEKIIKKYLDSTTKHTVDYIIQDMIMLPKNLTLYEKDITQYKSLYFSLFEEEYIFNENDLNPELCQKSS